MGPLSPIVKYLIGSAVAGLGVVETLRVLRVDLGNTVEGVIFRNRVRGSRNKRRNG